MSVDRYLDRTYNRTSYNCLHLARDVWLDETGEDIGDALPGLLEPGARRTALPSMRRRFRRLEGPSSPCLVLFQYTGRAAHVGVYLRGRVLHIQPQGVKFQTLENAGFGATAARFYK